MSLIWTSRTRTRQPRGAIRLASSVSDADLAYVATMRKHLVGGAPLAVADVNEASWGVDPYGEFHTETNALGRAGLTSTPKHASGSLTEATLLVLQRAVSTSVMSGWHNFQSDATNSHMPYNGMAYFSTFSTSRWLSGPSLPAGMDRPHVVVIRAKGTERKAWINGALLGSGTADATVQWSSFCIGTPNVAMQCMPLTYGMLILPRAVSDGFVDALRPDTFWQLFAPEQSPRFFSFANVLFSKLDETTASNTDYITTSTAGSVAEMQLGSVTDPGVDTLHSIKLRASGSGSLQVDLVQGSGALLPALVGLRDYNRPPPPGAQARRGRKIRHLWWATGTRDRRAVSAAPSLLDAAGDAHGLFGSGTGANPSGNFVSEADREDAIYFDPAGTGQLASTQLKVGDSGGSGAPNVGAFSIIARVWRSSVSLDTVVIYGGGSASVGLRTNSSGQLELLRTNQALIGTSSGTLSAATWHTVGVAYDGTNGTFYIDGKPAGTFSSSSSFTHTTQHYLGAGASGEWVSNITMRMRYLAVVGEPAPDAFFAAVHAAPWRELFAPGPSPRLIPAAKPIASRIIPLIATPTDYRRELLPAEAALITDYADLRVRFRGV